MRLAEFNPKNVANTAWAFAALGVQEEDLLGEAHGVQPAEFGEHGVGLRPAGRAVGGVVAGCDRGDLANAAERGRG